MSHISCYQVAMVSFYRKTKFGDIDMNKINNLETENLQHKTHIDKLVNKVLHMNKEKEDFQKKLLKYLYKLAATLDNTAIAQLELDKNIFFIFSLY